MGTYQSYTTMMADRDLKARQLAALTEKKSAFDILARTQKPPVEIVDNPIEPTIPLQPNRMILIVGVASRSAWRWGWPWSASWSTSTIRSRCPST